MNQLRSALVVLLTLVAVLAAAAPAGAKSPPDLVVAKISKPPASQTIGSKLKLAVTVGNKGGAQAPPSKLGLYLGKGKKHTKKDKRLKRVAVKALAPGEARKLKLKALLPSKTKPGTYRLFACADDTRQVKETKEQGNCRATKKLSLFGNARTNPIFLPASPSPALPVSLPPAAAFTMSDGIDWGFVFDEQRKAPAPGDPVTLTLTAGNGIPGQAGYTRSSVPPEGFRTGTGTILNFAGPNNSLDDGQVTRQLPFAFPFGGVEEQSISVSTNGWVSFGSPAWDYWADSQHTDYRGIQAVVGELERGLMPYWTDLNLKDEGAGAGTIKEVVAPDNSWVAFQWDLGQFVTGGAPRRTVQLVLFPDGRFRFDYPGENAEGGGKSFVGYSLGTSAASADVVSVEGKAVPSTSLLFTPKALPAASVAAAGEVTAILPKGSSFVSADAGCSLTSAPAAFSTGLVSCPMPALGIGDQASRKVTFAMPPKAPGQSAPANFRLLGTYLSDGLSLTDRDEIDSLGVGLEATTIEVTPEFNEPGISVGVPATFEVTIKASKSGLDEPTATFELTNATLSKVEIDGKPIECTPPSGGSITTCVLPSGAGSTKVEVTLIPTAAGPPGLKTTAQALNAPPATSSISVFP